MQYHRPLLEGILVKRYKRFFADVDYNGKTILAHVPNSGSMKGCSEPGSPCRFTFDDSPTRKIKYTLQMVRSSQSWVGVNTQVPNKIVFEAFEKKLLPHWRKFNCGQREVAINGKTRIDFAFWKNRSRKEASLKDKIEFKSINLKKSKKKFHFVEVKNVSLSEDGTALFPDSVTERGQKHLKELIQLVEWGHSAEILFTIQRMDVERFAPADHIDAEYGKLLRRANKKGVIITPLLCHLTEKEVLLTKKTLPLLL